MKTMQEGARDFDLVVFGATGFTGRLVAEYLLQTYGTDGPLRWAIAGRSATRLQALGEELGADIPVVAADAADPTALAALVRRARAVITTVGPYQLYGEALVEACAAAGTDYVDLCGEPAWMARMIPRLEAPARASGARIVFSCGFDSIPFDLGVLFLQTEARQRLGRPFERVHGRVRRIRGGPSGGTIASGLASLAAAARDPAVAATLADPFALTPGFRGPAQPDGETAAWDELAGAWSGPFVMATINTKNVHRSNALRGHPWGTGFRYDERMLTGAGASGRRRAQGLVRQTRMQNALLGFAPTRALLRRFVLPKPGEGPNREQRESGGYELWFLGQQADGNAGGQVLRATVTGDRDPGYGSTSKLIAEAALCLIDETGREQTPGGVWTPAAAMGLALVRRLHERAGLRFAIEPAA